MSEPERVDVRALRRLRDLPYGTARTAATEALVRRIEAEGPREFLAEALIDLVEAYSFSGQEVNSFTVFARLLRLWDESPELFDAADERNMFWAVNWVAGPLPLFPEISREQAESFLQDLRRRFVLAGKGLASIEENTFWWAWNAGLDEQEVEAARLRWLRTPRDEFDDCNACRIGRQVDYFTTVGKFAEAAQLGLTQEESCNLEPTRTFFGLALSLLELGRGEEAATYYQRGRADMAMQERQLPGPRGRGFEVLARGGHLDRALRVLREDDRELLTLASTPNAQLRFWISVLAGLSPHLAEPDRATGLREAEWATVGALHAWVLPRARELAARFDARNGTTFYADLISRALAATSLDTPLPLNLAQKAETESHGAPEPRSGAAPAARGLRRLFGRRGDRPDGADAVDTAAAVPSRPELSSQADSLAAAGDFAEATGVYRQLAAACEAEGLIAEAGVACAEAAHAAHAAGDEELAHAEYARAMTRLSAGGADPELRVRVAVAWSPVAVRVADVEAILGAMSSVPDDALSPRVRADLLDAFARVVASAPSDDPGRTRADAVTAAMLAGEVFAAEGAIADAAHAFWLAGKVQRELGEVDAAIWALESAMEGFEIARERTARAHAAGELIELLRENGQHERAEEIVAALPL